jgi:hypothetical protein
MENLSRRTMLKQVARISAVAAASSFLPAMIGCCHRSEKRISLNVVLHGLFVINFTNLGLELYTPFVDDHIYRAGNFDAKGLQHLHPEKIYRLRGVSHQSAAPDYDPTYDIRIDKKTYCHVFRPQYSVFVIELPFPETIQLIRPVGSDLNTYDCDHTQNTAVYTINRLSLCQVLSYSVPNVGKLELVGTDWDPYVRPETGTVSLHIWAEPLQRMTYNHAYKAYAKLSEMFEPLQFKLKINKTSPLDPNTGVYGLSPEEEQGLSEWSSAGEGSYPTNCSTVTRG